MEIHVILDSRLGPNALAELGVLAESQGIKAVWTSSLLDSRDPFVNLTTLAQETQSLRFGPIAVNPYDMHPVRISTALLTLNEFGQGRANIVIGGGGEALEALQIKPDKRVRAVRECLNILKGANKSQPLNFDGGLYHVKGYHPHWAEASAPRVYAGANMPQMLAMAARNADGIFLSDLPPTLVTNAIQTAKDAKGGSLDHTFRINNFFAWHVYDEQDRGFAEAKQWLALRGLFRRWVITTFLNDEEYDVIERNLPAFFQALNGDLAAIDHIPAHIIDALVENLTIHGGPRTIDRVVEKLQTFKDSGLTEIALRLYTDPDQSIKLIGKKIIPALG